jgi:hypothetical protein
MGIFTGRQVMAFAAALAPWVTACGPPVNLDDSGGGGDGNGGGSVTMTGNWVMHARSRATTPPGTDACRTLFVTFSDSGQGVKAYLDLDADGGFTEGISVVATGAAGGVRLKGQYTWNGTNYSFDTLVWEFSWGHAAGDATYSVGSAPSRSEMVTMVKIMNLPRHDLNGVWDIDHTLDWATGGLSYLAGMTESGVYQIAQEMSGPMQGFFEAKSADGKCFTGIVNDSQITLARRYEDYEWLWTYTYTNLNADGDWFGGTHLGQAELGALQEDVGWSMVAYRTGQ